MTAATTAPRKDTPEMSASTPDPRYFKDGNGLHPRWRFFFKWPKQYLWMISPRWFKSLRFAVQRRRHGR